MTAEKEQDKGELGAAGTALNVLEAGVEQALLEGTRTGRVRWRAEGYSYRVVKPDIPRMTFTLWRWRTGVSTYQTKLVVRYSGILGHEERAFPTVDWLWDAVEQSRPVDAIDNGLAALAAAIRAEEATPGPQPESQEETK